VLTGGTRVHAVKFELTKWVLCCPCLFLFVVLSVSHGCIYISINIDQKTLSRTLINITHAFLVNALENGLWCVSLTVVWKRYVVCISIKLFITTSSLMGWLKSTY